MAECSLYQVDGCSPIRGVRRMTVPKPMRGHLLRDPRSSCSSPYNAQDLRRVKVSTKLARRKNGSSVRRVSPKRNEILPQARRQDDPSCLPALPENGGELCT